MVFMLTGQSIYLAVLIISMLVISDDHSVTGQDTGAEDTALLIKIMNKCYLINISLFR